MHNFIISSYKIIKKTSDGNDGDHGMKLVIGYFD